MPLDKLKKYAGKRNFRRTPEPGATEPVGKQRNVFVIQKHDATNLHFDFRLQIGGVLVSWAVPKGPSINPKVKRLAIRVEDHPLSYGKFEGVIPAGQYGGGTVMVWDKGTYVNLRARKEKGSADMDKSLKEGVIEIQLKGKKLRGGYNLIRTRGFGGGTNKNSWLLFRVKDEFAQTGKEPVQNELTSAKSGKTMERIGRLK